ncbi:MAG: hypothetical protein AAB571_07100 [Chloroflexota bacterium]
MTRFRLYFALPLVPHSSPSTQQTFGESPLPIRVTVFSASISMQSKSKRFPTHCAVFFS